MKGTLHYEKILAFILVFCISCVVLCSCGISEGTTGTTDTTTTVFIDPAEPMINADNMDELLSELKTSDVRVAEIIRENGTLYYPEIKDANYYLVSITGTRTFFEYRYYANFDSAEKELGAYFDIVFNYEKRTMSDVIEELKRIKNKYELLDDGSVYDKTYSYLYFECGEYVHYIYTERDADIELNANNFAEIKSMDITE